VFLNSSAILLRFIQKGPPTRLYCDTDKSKKKTKKTKAFYLLRNQTLTVFYFSFLTCKSDLKGTPGLFNSAYFQLGA